MSKNVRHCNYMEFSDSTVFYFWHHCLVLIDVLGKSVFLTLNVVILAADILAMIVGINKIQEYQKMTQRTFYEAKIVDNLKH